MCLGARESSASQCLAAEANGKLDLDKVRKLSLTQKQEEKVQNLEKKQKKIGSLRRWGSLRVLRLSLYWSKGQAKAGGP